jgi:hypothetical protein
LFNSHTHQLNLIILTEQQSDSDCNKIKECIEEISKEFFNYDPDVQMKISRRKMLDKILFCQVICYDSRQFAADNFDISKFGHCFDEDKLNSIIKGEYAVTKFEVEIRHSL